MIWLISLVLSPLLLWVWMGIVFTIIDYMLNKEADMPERDRLIRFTELPDGLLSRFDAERNLIEIDQLRHDCLPRYWQTSVLFTELPLTKLADDANSFVEVH